ncbi:MAG: SDR family oxidoreductase [Anaerolineae bacterium]|nr:SDR family oxidoreductase [Anaerolineae bacterium]
MSEFDGKHVLITGGSRGIGRACAVAFARRGARVAVHYHTNHAAAQETLRLLDGAGHVAVAGDIADGDAVEGVVEQALSAFGRIDVLVSNAAIYEEQPPTGVEYAEWRSAWARALGTNLVGAANMAYCVARCMIGAGGGKMIMISSRAAFRGKPEAPAYAASKAGLNALGQNLAVALAPHNIFVYIVAPGVVETDMAALDKASPRWESILKQSPLGRVTMPEDVARTVTFLASEGTDMLTGAIIDVNGASYLRT